MDMMKEQAQAYNNIAENKFLFCFQPGNSYDMYFLLTGAGFELFAPNHDDPTKPDFYTPVFVVGLGEFVSIRDYLPIPAGGPKSQYSNSRIRERKCSIHRNRTLSNF